MWDNGILIKKPIQIDKLITAFSVERDKEYAFKGEAHNFWEMVYIKKGLAGFTADEKVFECPPDTVVFHKPNEFHKILNAGAEPIQFTVVSFVSNSTYIYEKLSNAVISLSHKGRSLMRELELIIESGSHSFEYLPSDFLDESNAPTVAQFCNTLELLLYECAASEKRITPKTSNSAKIFAMAVKKMNENIHKPMNALQLADELNISLAHLKRIFSRYALMGIHAYFLALKIEKAKFLLLEGKPITLVSDDVGFSTPNYFSTTFKRETGLTPSQWLKTFEQ